jgi:hypothetical protein
VSDKPFKALNVLDQELRRANGIGMEEGTKLIIKRICGFELFNTRPYHNYESWSDGYNIIGRLDGQAMGREEAARVLFDHVTDRDQYVFVSREDLDDAVHAFHAEQSRRAIAQCA